MKEGHGIHGVDFVPFFCFHAKKIKRSPLVGCDYTLLKRNGRI